MTISDERCDEIRAGVFPHSIVTEAMLEHSRKLIRAAYAAGYADAQPVERICPVDGKPCHWSDVCDTHYSGDAQPVAADDAALRADAERYRWLIANGTRYCTPLVVPGEEDKGPVDDEVQCELIFRLPPRPAWYANPGAAIDAAIDAAKGTK